MSADRGSDPGRRWRRGFATGLLVAMVVVLYAFAIDRVGVDLEQAKSETRQEQLRRIIRVLARPELTTTDVGTTVIEAPVSVPCGPDASGTGSGDSVGTIMVTPACAEPGATVTVAGEGFEPGVDGQLQFVPQSDFAVTLDLGRFTADDGGSFTAEVELPDRPADVAQQVRAVLEAPQGTWRNRVEVWDDTNDNGVRDQGIITEDGLDVTLEGLSVATPAVGLLDASNLLTEFVTVGDAFEADTGPATGQAAIPLDEVTDDGQVRVAAVSTAPDATTITITGPVGTDVSAWRAVVYDAETGALVDTVALGDIVRLSPRISDTASVTLEKIIDTVLLALVATTAGLLLAIPLSFFSARNLMRDILTPLLNLGLVSVAIPAGAATGVVVLSGVRTVLGRLPAATWADGLASMALLGLALVATRMAFSRLAEGTWRKLGATALIGVVGIAGMDRLALFLQDVGDLLRPAFGRLAFLPGLLSTLGEVLALVLTVAAVLGGAAVFATAASRLGYRLRSSLADGSRRVLAVALMATGGAVWAIGVGAVLDWLYFIDDWRFTILYPVLAGAVVGLLVAWRGMRHGGEVRSGMVVYYASRTVFNALRSIEPLVMVIVFVIWVGFGEFAGSLALAVHTAAALAKLYSEQVESISSGPLDAVRATGATRLQQVVYAVGPQVVPPYISFTMYRWDINVRMSTILGFAGGGGIGSILQQNLALGNYRAASVQMLAITIVVATMDWLSARLRERLI